MRFRSLIRSLTRAGGEHAITPAAGADNASRLLLPDDATIGRLRRFALNDALRPVDGLVGEHRSRRRGAAPEFSDHAPYTPGDDVRRIDWNVYARSDELYIRESEITTELDVHLLIDTSASMHWTGHPDREHKLVRAQRVAALLAWIALARSDRVTLTAVTDGPGETFGPVQGRGMAVPATSWLAAIRPGGHTDIATAVGNYVHARPRSGFLIVLTDAIGLTADACDHMLATLANGRWRVVLVQIDDPLERDPAGLATASDVLEIEDPESGLRQRINLQPDTVRHYTRARDEWLAGLRNVATRRAAPLLHVGTDMRMDPDVLLRLQRAGVIAS